MAMGHLKVNPKSAAGSGEPAGDAAARLPEPIPPPPPKKAKAAKEVAAVVRFQCGHECSAGLFTGQVCPACRSEKQKVKAAQNRERRERKAAGPKPPDDAGRLPDHAQFAVVYDAASRTWSGVLAVEGLPTFEGREAGVFALLRALDRQYRAAMGGAAAGE
jgi:hypothetical protein